MTGARDRQRPAPAADEAARWFVRLQDAGATRGDWLAFEAWLAASPGNMAAYEHVERLWVEVEEVADRLPDVSEAEVRTLPARQARTPSRLTRRAWLAAGAGLAASVAVAVAVGLGGPGARTQSYAAAPGHTQQVVLADGTRVWLNAGSRIEVRLARRARRVEMADGEALFDVTHDPRRPFLIDAGDRRVRVVGTQFNLRHRGGEFALTVNRGIVEVGPSQAAGPATRVVAGQSLSRRRGSATFVLAAASPETAFAWTRGELVYADAPLSEVAADLSRSLGVQIQVADQETAAIRFSGVLALDDRADVLRRLEAYAHVRAEDRPTGVMLHRR